ncbi:unnamed protein product [Brassica oleracea]
MRLGPSHSPTENVPYQKGGEFLTPSLLQFARRQLKELRMLQLREQRLDRLMAENMAHL